MSPERDLFHSSLDGLNKALSAATALSGGRIGVVHTGRQNRVLMAFAKTIAHSMTVELICAHAVSMKEEIGLLDHFSVAALARCVIDSAVMTLYLSEPSLSPPQWDLRRHILFLHDLTNRKRFLTFLNKARGDGKGLPLENYAAVKTRLLAVIDQRSAELGYPEDRRDEFRKGQLVFVDGVRGAVREAGMDLNQFESLHSYLSNHVHAHPASLLRAEEHAISFETPSDFQLGLCGTCMAAVTDYLEEVSDRIEKFTGDIGRDPVGSLE